jgi:hypothetical protein
MAQSGSCKLLIVSGTLQLEDLKKAEYYLKRLIDKAQDRVYSGRVNEPTR